MDSVRTIAEVDADAPPTLRAWLSIAILLLMTVLSSIDRGVIALMVDPIKADLHITDVQFSLLQGFAFALFYAMASLPMAWLADRHSRHWVIYLGVTGWSIATALCGLASSFGTLFLARLGVGVGEATLSPSAYAMTGDLFPPRRIALAIGTLAAGAAIGSALALGIGGLVVEWATRNSMAGFTSWKLVFIIVGLPGLVIAPLVFLIPRTQRAASAGVAAVDYGDTSYLRWLRQNARYLAPLFLGVAFHAVLAYSVASWTPAYFSRHFGLSAVTIGVTLGAVTGIAGIVGFIGGGWLIDRLHASAVRDAHYRYFIFNCAIIGTLGIIGFTVVRSVPMLLVLLAIIHALLPFTGPALAHLQATTPPRFRARTIALLMLTMNLLGMTLGPTSVALFSEKLLGGPEHVGSGIALTFAVFAPIACLCFALGIRPARRAIGAA